MAGGGIKVNNITLNGGADGATFVPSIDNDGYLSWTNNKGYPNPATVKVRGTTVVANPTESGTTTLTKLKVDNTVYNIPQGGGGDFDPTKYYTKTETDGLLNEKQDDLTQTQLNAVNSGITANKVSIYDNYANAINNKVDKETGKGLSTNDFTTAEKTKLAGIETGAEVNEIDTIIAGSNVTVSKSGKTVTISATGGGGSGVEVVQTTGQSTTAVMSQNAVTEALNGKASISYVQGNPTESGTVDLTKLKVGNTVYNVPQGGGSGGGTQLYMHTIHLESHNIDTFITLYSSISQQFTYETLRDYIGADLICLAGFDRTSPEVVINFYYDSVTNTIRIAYIDAQGEMSHRNFPSDGFIYDTVKQL